MRIVKSHDLTADFFEYTEMEEHASVKQIIADVKKYGDKAVKEYTREFDQVDLDDYRIEKDELKKSYANLDQHMVAALTLAAENIRQFAVKQAEQFNNFEVEIQRGVFTGQKIIAIDRVGIYVPGGHYPLPSTVLMGAIPARIAGVREIIICSPPSCNGTIHPAILAAADIAGVDEVYCIGGVQSIAAMAYGTETIKPVDKIVGPGNKYVTEAKRLVFGLVGIDFIAGPTEVMIIADDTAKPSFIAADLLAQAEHDTNAIPILVTNSLQLARQVHNEVERQLAELATAHVAKQSLAHNGLIIITDSLEGAVEICNKKAPEHLELQVKNPENYPDRLKNYGSLFIGELAAEVLGDYSSGLNHTLPTNTTARHTGGLSVKDFLKFQTTLRVTNIGLATIGPIAKKLADIEGLEGHGRSVDIRITQNRQDNSMAR